MWQLWTTNAAQEWVEIGRFDSLIEAARRIREMEDYPVPGVFFQIHVETEHGSDEEAFRHLEHTGRRALYTVKLRTN